MFSNKNFLLNKNETHSIIMNWKRITFQNIKQFSAAQY